MGAIQPWHLIIVLVIVLIVFGPSKLPDLGKSLGASIRGFREAIDTKSEPAAPTVASAADAARAAEPAPPSDAAQAGDGPRSD